MTQPGVYFTLDAPHVSIIGLYSNVLEHPGVISSQSGHFALPDDQLTFLASELARLKPEREDVKRAIVLAVHHPPVSFDATHAAPLGSDIGNYRMEVEPIFELGYLTLTVDLSSRTKPTLAGTFHSQAQTPTRDSFVLDLADGTVT